MAGLGACFSEEWAEVFVDRLPLRLGFSGFILRLHARLQGLKCQRQSRIKIKRYATAKAWGFCANRHASSL